MIITMNKNKENNEYVWYNFYIEIQAGTTMDSRGRARAIYNQKKGLFKFNKLHDLREKSIEIIEEKTDPCLLNNSKILFACLQKMLEFKKSNIYPNIATWASC